MCYYYFILFSLSGIIFEIFVGSKVVVNKCLFGEILMDLKKKMFLMFFKELIMIY